MDILRIFKKLFFRKELSTQAFFTSQIFSKKKYIIGDYTYGNPTVLFENNDSNLYIGKYCSIAEGVTIFLGGNHRIDWVSTYPFNVLNKYFPSAKSISGHPSTKGDVSIGNDVWIGSNVTIMSGVSIENGAVIASRSVITKNVGPYELWAGNPAKFIKKRFSDEDIDYLQKLKWWDWDEKKIDTNVSLLCSKNPKLLLNEK